METPTDRNLAFAREAASNATFRVLFVFLVFGVSEVLETIARVVAVRLDPTPATATPSSGPDLSVPLQLTFLVIALAFCMLKLGAMVAMLRTRTNAVRSVPLLVALAAIGVAGRGASYVISLSEVRTLVDRGVPAIAEWSMATSLSSTISIVFDTLMIFGVFIASAITVMNDRVPPEKPPTYREAPHV